MNEYIFIYRISHIVSRWFTILVMHRMIMEVVWFRLFAWQVFTPVYFSSENMLAHVACNIDNPIISTERETAS